MFQLSIKNKKIGLPMTYQEGCIWMHILAATFPFEVIWLKSVNERDVNAVIIFPTREESEVTK